jgi:hypothetical protein
MGLEVSVVQMSGFLPSVVGALAMEFGPHGTVCGNAMRDNGGGSAVGTYKDLIGDPAAAC